MDIGNMQYFAIGSCGGSVNSGSILQHAGALLEAHTVVEMDVQSLNLGFSDSFILNICI